MIPTKSKVDTNLKYIYNQFYKNGHYISETHFIKDDGQPDFQFSEYTADYMYNKGLLELEQDSAGHKMYRLSEFGVEVVEQHETWTEYIEIKNSRDQDRHKSQIAKDKLENQLKELQKEKLEHEKTQRYKDQQIQTLKKWNLILKLLNGLSILIGGVFGILTSDWVKALFIRIWEKISQ